MLTEVAAHYSMAELDPVLAADVVVVFAAFDCKYSHTQSAEFEMV